MKKALKITGKILLGLLAVVSVLLLCVFVFNKVSLAGEKKILKNQKISQMVEVDGKQMSIYAAGEGDHTLLFLAGSGATAPVLDFLPFANRFADNCKVVIAEKFGYGFSDEYIGSRDIETRVRQYRDAMKAADIQGPYILCPHSYSGLEAIYWAQN